MEKKIKTIIQLRRDNESNYPSEYIPRLGEVLLIDTPSKGLQAKVGNGLSTFEQLDYYIGDVVIRGYYYNNSFYEDFEHTVLFTGSVSRIYIDVARSKIYTFDGTKYNTINDISNASNTEAGIVKLYNEHGSNTDGTMTQKAITDADNKLAGDISTLSEKVDTKIAVNVDEENELAIFIK